MCHTKTFNLQCGHTRVVHIFCPHAFLDVATGLSVPCNSAKKSDSNNGDDQDAFCTRRLCCYKGRGWWCCKCQKRNLATHTPYCQNPLAPVAGSGEDMPPEGSICDHWRCEGCVNDCLHWSMMEHPELYNARKKQEEKNDDEGKEKKEDEISDGWETVDDAVPGATAE